MEDNAFISIAALICEPTRGKILWKLLDGKAYTASELATYTDTSPTALSNHLSKLLKGNILKVMAQGRHRYYSFANENVAYAVEALASLAPERKAPSKGSSNRSTITYCRTCYDHLAGYVGVRIAEAMVEKGYLQDEPQDYLLTNSGWNWLSQLGITKDNFTNRRRPLTRKCLDWSERRPHIAGQLGAAFLEKALKENWFRKVAFSRELVLTSKGRQILQDQLEITL